MNVNNLKIQLLHNILKFLFMAQHVSFQDMVLCKGEATNFTTELSLLQVSRHDVPL